MQSTHQNPTEITATMFDPEIVLKRNLQLIQHQIAECGSDPSVPFSGMGPAVKMAIDCEWVFDAESQSNIIISAQFFVIAEHGEYSRIFYTSGRSREDRLQFGRLLVEVIEQGIEQGAIIEWPSQVIVSGFFLRADLAAFSDLPRFKNKLDSVGGSVASVRTGVDFVFVEAGQ